MSEYIKLWLAKDVVWLIELAAILAACGLILWLASRFANRGDKP